jgi:polyisoprenoid-binding protein YceI
MRRRPCAAATAAAFPLVLALAVGSANAQTASAAETYNLDRAHSTVGFSVRHMGLSHVRGQFDDFAGEFLIDEADLTQSSIRVEIQAVSVNTYHAGRDGDLRGEGFFDVAHYPTIVFESRSIEQTGEGQFVVTGDLTMLGVAREIRLPVTVSGPIELRGGHRMGIDGEVTIDRKDWGMKYDAVMDNGGLVVANDVTIHLGVELKR